MHRNARPNWARDEWPFVKRTALIIACIHVACLLAIGAVVWHAGGKLEPRTPMAAQAGELR